MWQLCEQLGDALGPEAEVWLITNPDGTVATWAQRAASSPDKAIVWDYHVVLLTKDSAHWQVWDFDHDGPFVRPALDWLRASFPVDTQAELAPHFRCIPAADYLANFSSDRSHMHAPGRDDLWLASPPEWPPIGAPAPSVLQDWLDCDQAQPGSWQSLAQLRARLSSTDPK